MYKPMLKFSGFVLACALAAPALAADSSAWQGADWIGFTKDGRTSNFAQRAFFPEKLKKPAQRRVYVSSLLRKPFRVEKPVRSASVQVCGLGLHELYLNGDKVGDRALEPAAIPNWQRALQLNPKYGSAWAGLAMGLEATGHANKAERALVEAVRHKPVYGDAEALRAALILNDRQLEQILPTIERFDPEGPGWRD